MLPIVWGWEYGARTNLTEINQRWFPLVKGVSDFFACWFELDETDGFMHDNHDCFTMPGAVECTAKDSVKTLSMVSPQASCRCLRCARPSTLSTLLVVTGETITRCCERNGGGCWRASGPSLGGDSCEACTVPVGVDALGRRY